MAANAFASSSAHDRRGLREVLRGFGALTAGSLAGQLLGFAALAYVARRTGPANLGAYTLAFLFAAYFGLFASAGIDYLAMRDVAQNTDSLGSIVGETLVLQGLLAVILYLALIALAPFLLTSHQAQRLAPIAGISLFTATFTLDWALLALGRAGSVAFWRLLGQVISVALILVFVDHGNRGIFQYTWLTILGLVVTGGGLIWTFSRIAHTRLRLSTPRALLRRIHRSVAFGYSLVMIRIYASFGTLMLGYLASTHAVGIFAAANKVPFALAGLANLWLNVFFPHTAQQLLADARGFARDLGQVVTVTLVIAAAATVGAFLCAGTLMSAMFGSSFEEASLPFALLAAAAALVLLQANFSIVLLAGGSQRYYARIMTIAAAIAVLLNLLLIPPFGVAGAASATLLGECCLTLLALRGVRRCLGPIRLHMGRLFRGAIAVGVMTLAMVGARSLGGALVQVGVGLTTFAATALTLRVVDRDFFRR